MLYFWYRRKFFQVLVGCLHKSPPFVISVLNESNVSVNTPGKEGELVTKRDPSFNDNPSDTSASPLHIVAAKDENKHTAVLCARKIGNFYRITFLIALWWCHCFFFYQPCTVWIFMLTVLHCSIFPWNRARLATFDKEACCTYSSLVRWEACISPWWSRK